MSSKKASSKKASSKKASSKKASSKKASSKKKKASRSATRGHTHRSNALGPRSKTAKRKVSKQSPKTQGRLSSTSSFTHYNEDALAFLVELSMNNDRDWFKANQDRYEASVREPTLALIRAMAPRLRKVSKHLVANDRKVGGSMMRPQRDTRFSPNKDPYKTNVGVHFRHDAGKDVHAPGCYFHFDADGVWVAVGIWRPEADALAKVRTAIAKQSKRYVSAIAQASFQKYFELSGDSLKRPPKGYSAEHPMIEALKRKDHIAVCSLKPTDVHQSGLVDEIDRRFMAGKTYMKFLCDAMRLPF